MNYIVGAYATAPVTSSWDPEIQSAYFAQLKNLTNVRGLEHPFTGSLHPHDEAWFLNNIDPAWDFVFTGVPGVMDRLSQNPEFGLASDSESGRAAALEFYAQARQAILKLNRHLGRQAVKTMLIHSAPKRSAATSSASVFQQSLQTMQRWDWGGAELVLEHCDTYVEGQVPSKGFLTLEEEIGAINGANAETGVTSGICINWGRSVLETRSVQGPLEHIAKAKQAKLLRGLMFSGASGAESAYGAWKDSHMPQAQAFGVHSFAEESLLTGDEFNNCLQASSFQDLDFLGVKIGVRPQQLGVVERVEYIKSALEILDKLTQ